MLLHYDQTVSGSHLIFCPHHRPEWIAKMEYVTALLMSPMVIIPQLILAFECSLNIPILLIYDIHKL